MFVNLFHEWKLYISTQPINQLLQHVAIKYNTVASQLLQIPAHHYGIKKHASLYEYQLNMRKYRIKDWRTKILQEDKEND